MSRTSKTKIGDSGESNDRMMRAAASGHEAVARAHGELMDQYRAGAQQANQTAATASQIVGAGEERQQQQAQFQQKMAQDQSQFERTASQRDDQINLEGAKAGYEKEPDSDRAARLEAEMQRGQDQPQIGPLEADDQERLNEQVSKKMEMDPSGRWRPTAEKKQEQTRQDFKADTERMRAMAYRDQVGLAAQKALAKGDMDAYTEKAKELAKTPNDMQKRYDRFMNKHDVNSNDWSELSDLARGGPDSDPSLMQDIKAQDFTPRVAAFVRAQVQKDALSSIVLSKGNTSHLEVDWTAPKMREFQQQVSSLNEFMRSNPAMGQLAFIKSTDDKMRFLNVMAASQVLLGMTRAPSPSGGMMPATQPPMQGGAQPPMQMGPAHTGDYGQQTGANAVRQARAGGASPMEALQQGQNAQPTGEEGNYNPPGLYH